MLPDAEIVKIATEVFEALGWNGRYTIKLNHRKILDGIFEVCGVPSEKIRTISSAVDKLDKLPWEDVKREMTQEKGLAEEVADRIGEYVVQKGQHDLLKKLQADERLTSNASMKAGMEDMDLLFNYLDSFNALQNVSFDLSLARGLDYYTGVIYEIVTEGSAPGSAPLATTSVAGAAPPKPVKKPSKAKDADEDRSDDPSVGIGSVAAGGRYDNLVGMFSGKTQIPCVGISFGVDRIFAVTKARMAAEKTADLVRNNEVDVYVMAFGGKGFTGLLKERMSVCTKLWEAGIKVGRLLLGRYTMTNALQAEFSYKVKPKLPNQFKAAEVNGIPFAIILGEEEIKQNKIRLKEMGLREDHPEKDGVLVELHDMVSEVKERIRRKAELDGLITQAEGMKVVGGIKGDAEKTPTAKENGVAEISTAPAADGEKPAPSGDGKAMDVETIGAVPAS